ncbi:MAG: KOW motif-containing protein [Lachnospiraceae bacterium]|nr:KOW motif-containing protein [Lachnospiraceae bacterium]
MSVYVIYTQSGKELKAFEKIQRLVLLPTEEVYIPTYNRQRKREGEYQIVEKVLLYKLCGKEHVLDVSTGYYEGKGVRIIKGPLMGLEGQIKKINRHKRIAILELEMLSRMVEITVGLEVIY